MSRRRSSETCCQRFEHTAANTGVFFMNIVDFFIGSMFLTFGIYLRVHLGSKVDDVHTAWLAVLVIILGACLLSIVALSFTSLNLTDCKIGVVISGYLALFVSITSLIMGITAIVVQGDLYDYLDSHGDDLGLADKDISSIKKWYTFIIIGLFCSFIMQFIRFKWSKFLYKKFAVRDTRYQGLLSLEEDEYEVRLNAGRAERTEKYDNLRSHYKSKYASGSESAAGAGDDDLAF
jgi:hypothetical protein